jgi:hypothetical protein
MVKINEQMICQHCEYNAIIQLLWTRLFLILAGDQFDKRLFNNHSHTIQVSIWLQASFSLI